MLFTPEELQAETRLLCEHAASALEAGAADQVRYPLGRISPGHFELLYSYLHWVARIAGRLLRGFAKPVLSRSLPQWRADDRGRRRWVLAVVAAGCLLSLTGAAIE